MIFSKLDLSTVLQFRKVMVCLQGVGVSSEEREQPLYYITRGLGKLALGNPALGIPIYMYHPTIYIQEQDTYVMSEVQTSLFELRIELCFLFPCLGSKLMF